MKKDKLEEEFTAYDYLNVIKQEQKQEDIEMFEKILDNLNAYETALLKIHNTHKNINWACIFLIRLKKELKQKLKEMKK